MTLKKLDRFKLAVEQDPQDIDAWMNLGDVYYDEDEYSRALECYEKAAHINPYSSEIWNNIGLVNSWTDSKTLFVFSSSGYRL